jgi:energy-converting hydrogenase Eha subunit E
VNYELVLLRRRVEDDATTGTSTDLSLVGDFIPLSTSMPSVAAAADVEPSFADDDFNLTKLFPAGRGTGVLVGESLILAASEGAAETAPIEAVVEIEVEASGLGLLVIAMDGLSAVLFIRVAALLRFSDSLGLFAPAAIGVAVTDPTGPTMALTAAAVVLTLTAAAEVAVVAAAVVEVV